MKKLRLFDSLKLVLATVACTFILNVAHAATLPAGYTELEYIEGTGTQYIDTGITDIVNLKTELVAQLTSIQTTYFPTLIGAGLSSSSSDYYKVILGYHETQFYSQSGNGSGYKYFGNLDTNKHTFIVDNGTDSQTITMDGTIYTSNYAITTDQTVPLAIFARKSPTATNSYTRMKVWSVKFWHNGVLIQNLVPAKNSSGVVGMYDLADANPATAFHTNAGTGEFVAGEWQIKIATTKYNEESFAPVKTDLSAAMNAVDDVVTRTMSQAQAIDQIATSKQTRPDEGCSAKYCLLVEDEDGTPHWYPIAGANGVAHNLPAGYTELQYIESTGTQYIDTGYIPNSNTKLVLDVLVPTLTTGACTFAGAMNDAWRPGFGVYGGNTTYKMASVYDSSDVTGNPEYASNTRYTIELNGRVYTVSNDGAVVYTYTHPASSSFVAPATLNLFMIDINPDRYGKFRLYSAKIYNNDTLVRNFVPAKNSNNVVGMYDLADPNPSTAFYTNAGTGTFTAGPDM